MILLSRSRNHVLLLRKGWNLPRRRPLIILVHLLPIKIIIMFQLHLLLLLLLPDLKLLISLLPVFFIGGLTGLDGHGHFFWKAHACRHGRLVVFWRRLLRRSKFQTLIFNTSEACFLIDGLSYLPGANGVIFLRWLIGGDAITNFCIRVRFRHADHITRLLQVARGRIVISKKRSLMPHLLFQITELIRGLRRQHRLPLLRHNLIHPLLH